MSIDDASAPEKTAGLGATAGLSDRSRAERKLGWMLAGPAFVVMLLVTAYPILQAVYDSLFYYRLTDPENRSFIGLANYWVILTDSLWWQALWRDACSSRWSRSAVELVLGFALAW